MRILVVNPNSSVAVTSSFSDALNVFRFDGGPQIDCVTLSESEAPPGLETQCHVEHVSKPLTELVRKEKKMTDAFVIACYSDPGLYACREVAHPVPVFGISQCGLSAALSLGDKFGVIGILKASISRHLRYYAALGVLGRLAAERSLDMGVTELLEEEKAMRRLTEVGVMLKEDGASVIILGCAGMSNYRAELESRLELPVIDPVQAAVSTALLSVQTKFGATDRTSNIVTQQKQRTALVVGATGMAGSGIVEELTSQDDWQILALSRHPTISRLPKGVIPVKADIWNKEDIKRALGPYGVTHVFIAALYSQANLKEGKRAMKTPVGENETLFDHALEAVIEGNSSTLQHVMLTTGGKYYGRHLGPNWKGYRTYLLEDHPQARHPEPDMYWHQEDYLVQLAAKHGFTWSVLRPGFIIGYPLSNRPTWLNFGTSVALYAVIMKEIGQPFIFPGDEPAYMCLTGATSTRQLGRLAVWSATNPRAQNNAFNCANDDPFCWADIWPKIASFFGIEAKIAEHGFDIEQALQSRHEVWGRIVDKYNLKDTDLDRLLTPGTIDVSLARSWDGVFSPVKRIKLGFATDQDNFKMFGDLFEQLQNLNVIPRYTNSKL